MLWNRSPWPPRSKDSGLDIMDENINSSDMTEDGSANGIPSLEPCDFIAPSEAGVTGSVNRVTPGVTVPVSREDFGDRFGL